MQGLLNARIVEYKDCGIQGLLNTRIVEYKDC